jgi:biopolymer transport protein ExbD/biopolymer transport protein TolR
MAMVVTAAGGRGKKGRAHPEMNVTPLVDVVLVLLIIFMVLTAVLNEHFWVNIPEKEKPDQIEPPAGAADEPLVVMINGQGQIQINRDVYPDQEFPTRLKRMLVARGDRRVYFDAEDGVPYERAVQVLDLARGGGAAHVAVLTEKLE